MTEESALAGIYLPDSWVLELVVAPQKLCFLLEAALEEGHPLFYSPPERGEMDAFAEVWWCIEGAVHWNEGPNLGRPATDATGSRDFGHIDVWLRHGENETLEGDWGSVLIANPVHHVEYRLAE